ncbi:hypothetical protein ACET3Z_024765 [Daucus carota]
MSGGSTLQCEQDIQKLENYLPLLENFIHQVNMVSDSSRMLQWTSELRISWSSALTSSSFFSFLGQKFFQIDSLLFELSMMLFLNVALLREWAFELLSKGEPPIRQYLAMDTGSRLTWVIGDSLRREFNYSSHRSSTSGYIKCHSDTCKTIMKTFCNSNDKCMHYTSYADGNHGIQTYIAYDRFVFENDVLDKVIMDIYYKGKGRLFHEDNFYGIFGLSPPYPSFVHRLGDLGAKKFTYYINGKVTDTFHPYARLILGDADIQNGLTTPLHIDGAQYHLGMECIILGEQCLAIDRKIFAKKAHGGGTGVIIDTGSIFTYVAKEAYDGLDLAQYMDQLYKI